MADRPAFSFPARPKSRSLFYPSGPLTAKHIKKREFLISAEQSIWSKSGPPTAEARKQKDGSTVPALLDKKAPAAVASRAIVDLNRDLKDMLGQKKEDSSISQLMLPPEARAKKATAAAKPRGEDDLSDDELWEAVGVPGPADKEQLRKKAMGRLVEPTPPA